MEYYYMAFVPGQDGIFLILSPDFREIASQGRDVGECMDMSIDALEIMAQEYARQEKKLPPPCGMVEARKRIEQMLNDIQAEIPSDIIYQLAPMPEANLAPVRISATFPRITLDIIDRKARAHGMTRSGFLALAAQAFE